MSSRSRRIVLIAGIIAGVLILAGCGVLAYRIWAEKEEERIRMEKEQQEKERQEAVYLNNEEMPASYREYAAENPDVYAWLEIPGTNISYPIVQREEDGGFYLSHNALGQEDEKGAVFTESYNHKDFQDLVTVLYGNRMEDGSMFGGLLEYEDQMYFEDHREIVIYTPDKTLHYKIFAAYCSDNSHLLLSRDLSKTENFAAYIREIYQHRGMKIHIDESVNVSTEDHLLALSTGYPGDSEKRFLIQAVMIQNK